MKTDIVTLLFCLISLSGFSQETFRNPILPGSYPDPSICRVGEEYYLVNSSFEYFPGLPIHKSKDLVNWELIGYGLLRKEQVTGRVNLADVQSNGGIHAPTIRFHQGLFYIITTNVYYDEKSKKTDFVNFIITATKAEGPWSDPTVIEGAPGIDPDIFFDDNSTVWYIGTHTPDNPDFPGQGEIWIQEINLKTLQLMGDRQYLWRGACGGVWVEGPHLYKHDGRYYLMVAEGGTSYNHAVMIAVSDSIKGPYVPNERNPIFTSRHLSYDHWVHSTGHADMVQLTDNRWFMVLLGVRGDENRNSNMGRETHLLPVVWEREPFEWKQIKYTWPVCAPETGKLSRYSELPFKESKQLETDSFLDDFNTSKLNIEWNFRRVPQSDWHNLDEHKGFLRLYASNQNIQERMQTSLMGVRQRESDFIYDAQMNFLPTNERSAAGISLFQKDDSYLLFMVQKIQDDYFLLLNLKSPGQLVEKNLHSEKLPGYTGEILFRVKSEDSKYTYTYSLNNGESYQEFFVSSADLILCYGYTGAYMGLYAYALNTGSDFADFDWIKCKYFQR